MQSNVADTIPMGLYSFALVTCMSGFINLKVGTDNDAAMFAPAFGIGGCIQLLTGIFEIIRGNQGSGTIFTGFGFYWIVHAILSWPTLHVADLYADDPQQFNNFWGLFLIGYSCSSYVQVLSLIETTWCQVVLLTMASTNYLLLALFMWTQVAGIKTAAGVTCVCTGILAFYIATSLFLNATCPLVHLPLGQLPKIRRSKSLS